RVRRAAVSPVGLGAWAVLPERQGPVRARRALQSRRSDPRRLGEAAGRLPWVRREGLGKQEAAGWALSPSVRTVVSAGWVAFVPRREPPIRPWRG
ncbi:MAG: hypothetical protein K2X52_10190, partial [Mycobacteriaceae bacterium]|nr:hypothetical protein [Mycobacteriaceae bacterium]